MKRVFAFIFTFSLLGGVAMAEQQFSPPVGLKIDSPSVESTISSEDDLVKAAEAVNKEKATEKKLTVNAEKVKESEIPVLTGTKIKKSAMGESYTRLIASLGIVMVFALAMILFGKWWGKKHKRNDLNTQIRVMTQYHIGPRKSLAIVRVAGEHILIGMTDHNISMLKTLALIDDEYPEAAPKFSESLAELEDFEESQAKDTFSFGDVKDVVSSRLRKMRTL